MEADATRPIGRGGLVAVSMRRGATWGRLPPGVAEAAPGRRVTGGRMGRRKLPRVSGA